MRIEVTEQQLRIIQTALRELIERDPPMAQWYVEAAIALRENLFDQRDKIIIYPS